MELRHLRYFVAVAEELNFRRAAERLRLAQPSLGRQVRGLEEEIGVRLFERDRKHVALTDAGRVLLGEARTLLAGAAAAMEAAREAGRGKRGTLRIGNVGILSASFLPGSLAAFRKQFPQVEIDVLELGLDEQVVALLAGTIQVGFQARTPRTPVDRRLTERAVLTCGLVVAMPTTHHLAKERRLSLRMLAGEKLLHLEPRPGAGYDRWVQALCEEAGGFKPRFRRPAVGNIEALLGMVAAGEGVAILAEIVTQGVRAPMGWIVKVLDLPRPQFQVAAVWNAANPSVLLSNYLSLLNRQMSLGRRKSVSKSAKVVDLE